MERIEDHLQEEVYGAAYKFSPDVIMQYARVLLMIAAGDGVVSATEWRFLEGRAKAMGIPEKMIASWREIDYRAGDLKTEVKKFWDLMGAPNNAFIYDAVKMASADGYVEGEKKALRVAAEACGISESVVSQIETLCIMEESVRQHRISLLYPQASVFHASKKD